MIVPPTAAELRAFLETHGLTQKQLSELLPVSPKTLEAWLAGNRQPLAYLTRALRDVERELKGKK